MLDNLREMIEYENQTEEIQDLMLEGTDSNMMDFFIDEDGEADIPDSELSKILNKIPEYDEDKELNKKLSRITEAYIPEAEIIYEKGTLKKIKNTYKKAKLKGQGDNDDYAYDTKRQMAYGAVGGALPFIAMPPLAIVGAAFGAGATAGFSALDKARSKIKIAKYAKGEKITRKTVTDLINACQTKKDIKKVEKWVRLLYGKFKTIHADDPNMMKEAESWRLWLNKEILDKKIPAKKEEIKRKMKENRKIRKAIKEEFCPDYDNMTEEEFIEEMEFEEAMQLYDSDDYNYLEEISNGQIKSEIKKDYLSKSQIRDMILNVDFIDDMQNCENKLSQMVKVLYKLMKKSKDEKEKKKYKDLIDYIQNDARVLLDKQVRTLQKKKENKKYNKKSIFKRIEDKMTESFDFDIEFPDEY